MDSLWANSVIMVCNLWFIIKCVWVNPTSCDLFSKLQLSKITTKIKVENDHDTCIHSKQLLIDRIKQNMLVYQAHKGNPRPESHRWFT